MIADYLIFVKPAAVFNEVSMKKILSFILLSIALSISLVFCACAKRSPVDNEPESPVAGESSILIAYFTWSGNSRQLANWVAKYTGGEIFRIVPEKAYPETYGDATKQAKEELNNGTRPALSTHIDEQIMAGYETVFLGFPIWWYELPMSVVTFLEEYDFSGKTVIPFFTHGGTSDGGTSLTTLKSLLPDSQVLTDDAISIANGKIEKSENDIQQWIANLGYARD